MTEASNNGQTANDPIAEKEAALAKLISEAQQALEQIRSIQSQVANEGETVKNSIANQEVTFKTAVDGHTTQVTAANAKFNETKTQFDIYVQTINDLAIKAAATDQKITAYETAIGEINEKSQKQLEEILGLLPAATSAGLASKFNERRLEFLKPQGNWNVVFFTAIALLIALGIYGLVQAGSYKGDIDLLYIAKLWALKLPLVAVFVWLAMYAARERALAKRLEEDYGFKAAVAASLHGFQAQAEKVSATDPNAPISKLYDNTLREIANSPGRIYEKHKLVPNIKDDLAK